MSTAFLIDPALKGHAGHHAAVVSGLIAATGHSASKIRVLGNKDQKLSALDGVPVESIFTGGFYEDAPASASQSQARLRQLQLTFRQELAAAIPSADAQDTVHLLHPRLQVLNGLAAWSISLPRLPSLSIYFLLPPEEDDFIKVFGRADALICALDRLKAIYEDRLRLVATSDDIAAVLSGNGHPPDLLVPYIALRKPLTPRTLREPSSPPVIGIAGHFGARKGLHLVPSLIDAVSAAGVDVQWRILGASFEESPWGAEGAIVGRQAAVEARLEAVDADAYDSYLQGIDLLVLPYDPVAYARRGSGVAEEADFTGIPFVAPECELVREAAAAGTALTFQEQTAESIARSIALAVSRLSDLTACARERGLKRREIVAERRGRMLRDLFQPTKAKLLVAHPELPLVDIIVTLHNYARFLPACLASVKAQTYPNWRCIVVDDASDDIDFQGLRAMVAQAGEGFSLTRHAMGEGQLGGIATGLSLGSSPFVVLLDADDELLEHALDTHVAWHLNQAVPVAMTSGRMRTMDRNGRLLSGAMDHIGWWEPAKGMHPLSPSQAFRRPAAPFDPPSAIFLNQRTSTLSKWYWSPTSGLMFRRATMEIVTPDAFGLGTHSGDTYYTYCAFAIGGVIMIEAPVAHYRRHGSNGLSSTPVYGSGTLAIPETDPGWKEVSRALCAHIESDKQRISRHIASDLLERILASCPPDDELNEGAPEVMVPVCLTAPEPVPWYARWLPGSLLRRQDPRSEAFEMTETVGFAAGGAGKALLVSGWARPEPWGTWSVGARAVMVWRLGSRPTSGLRMTIDGAVYPKPNDGSQTIWMSANGIDIGRLSWKTEGDYCLSSIWIPAEATSKGQEIELVFTIRRPSSPLERGESDDSRMLGLGLKAVRVDYDKAKVVS